MAADIEEASQNPVLTPNYDDRFPSYNGRYKLSRLRHLLDTCDHLPRPAENFLLFEISNAGIHVPGRWYGRCLRQWRTIVVASQNLWHGHRRTLHHLPPSLGLINR